MKVALTAVDGISGPVKKATDSVNTFTAAAVNSSTKSTDAFNKIAQGAENLSNKANALVTALGGLAAAAFIQNLLQGASVAKDMSEAFGISVASVLELQGAFAAAGRGPEKLNQALATLSDTAVSALQGNLGLQVSYEKLGVSMSDLQKLSAKEVIAQIAQTMTQNGKPSAEQLAASYNILGRSAKGLPWEDVRKKLMELAGTQDAAASSVDSLDGVMKKMESSALAVKTAFIVLIAPVADFLNTLTSSKEGAKLAAEGIAAALLIMGGGAVIGGLNSVITAVKTLVGYMGALFAESIASTGATILSTNASAADAAAKTIQAVGLARVGTATVRVAEAQAAAAAATQAYGIFSLEATAATAAYDIALTNLTGITSAAATAQRVLSTAVAVNGGVLTEAAVAASVASGGMATVATTTTVATGALGRFAAVGAGILAFFTAPAWGTIAIVVAGLAAAIAAGTVIWKAFGDVIESVLGRLYEWTKKLTVSAFDGIVSGLTSVAKLLREVSGLPPIVDKVPSATASERPNANYSNEGRSDRRPTTDTALAAGTQLLDKTLAQVVAMKEQYQIEKLTNGLAEARIALQTDLIGKTEQQKIEQLATFDSAAKYTLELAKINSEITKMQATIKGGGDEAAKQYGGQLAILKQQAAEKSKQIEQGSIINKKNLDLADLLEKQKKLMSEFSLSQKEIVDGYNKTTAASERRLAFEQTLIGMGADAVDVEKAKFAELERQNNAIDGLIVQREKLALAGANGDANALEQIKILEATIASIKAGGAAATTAMTKATESTNALKNAQAATEFVKTLNRSNEDYANALADTMQLQLTVGDSNRSALQMEIELKNQIIAKQREINDLYGDESKLTDAGRAKKQAAMTEAIAQITAAGAVKAQANAKDVEQQTSFATGWQKSYADYTTRAYNSADQAKTYFETFSKGAEDAMVKFAQTGKLSFKDLANSLIADFIRIETRKAMSGIFGSISSFFGFGGGGITGGGGGGAMANGGQVQSDTPYLIGERGPEMFVPQNAGKIVPNHSLGGGSNVVNNTTEVTYSIQAVDASSFRSLLARDPEFIHNVAEQGRRQLPIRSRR